MINWHLISLMLWGCGGALIPDLIRIAKTRNDSTLLPFLRSGQFLLSLAAMIVLSVLAVVLLGAESPREALAFGYGAPDLLTSALSSSSTTSSLPPPPDIAPKGGQARFMNLRDWWSH
jgi:hypothetical protein